MGCSDPIQQDGLQEFPGKPFLGGKVGNEDGVAPRLMAKTSSAFSPYLDLFDNTVHIDYQTYRLNGMWPVPVPPSRANQSVIARPCLSDRGRP